MRSKLRWTLAVLVLTGTALLAQVNVEVHRVIEFVGDAVKVKVAQISDSMTAASVTADTVTVTGGLKAGSVVSSGALQAKGVTCESLATDTIGAAGKPPDIKAGTISAKSITAGTLAVDKITLTQGGKPVGEWGPEGLILRSDTGTVKVDLTAGPDLTMTSADGKTTLVASLTGDKPSIRMNSEAGQTFWQIADEQPVIVLGDTIVPPPEEQTIQSTDGMDDLESQVRYWVSAQFSAKGKEAWRIEWTAHLQSIREFFRPQKVNITVRFLDKDGVLLGQQNAFDIALVKNGPVAVTGSIDAPPEYGAQIRKVDLVIHGKRR